MSKAKVLLTVCLVAAMSQVGASVPYSVDPHTLHLYHFDGDATDSMTTSPIDLVLDSGATATDAKVPGLGQALYTYEGTSATGTNLPSAMAAAETPISNFVGADGAFTFEALVCPAFDLGSLPNHMQIISGDHDAARGWHFRVDSAGNLVFTKLTGTIQDDMRTPVPSSGPHAFAANKWFHAAVTYNGQANTDGNLKLYWTALDSGAAEAVLLGSFNLTADLDPGIAPSFVIGNEGRSGNGRTENWEGWIDEVRISDVARSASEMIPRVVLPTAASAPVPADGAVDVPRDQVLAWKPGVFAATHDVYLGTTLDDVTNASTTDPLGVLVSEGQDTTTYEPVNPLALGQTYYWRIDEVNAPSNPGLYEGEVWSFEVEPVAYPVENITVTAS
ncbi:MAG: LamG domain-containing protein, partial [Sedimentisphaerales bacterium]|nr:LamG domain-containing protein [Sedimentisphaerales bacterium]